MAVTQHAQEHVMATPTNADTSFTVRRLTLPIPQVEEFRERYERVVPPLPIDEVLRLIAERAAWEAMIELVNAAAPHSFFIYFKNDIGPVMRNAGHAGECVSYLMGNHVIAETMYRHDPRAMLYAPLRTLIWEGMAGDAWFTVDQPSTQFRSLGLPQVERAGLELDHKLAGLLETLDVPVPEVLREKGGGHQ
jgi:hypothetical protein